MLSMLFIIIMMMMIIIVYCYLFIIIINYLFIITCLLLLLLIIAYRGQRLPRSGWQMLPLESSVYFLWTDLQILCLIR